MIFMNKDLFLSLLKPEKGNSIDNNNQILLPEIPFYGISGTICRIEETEDSYYKVLYNQDGTIKSQKIPVPKKKSKNLSLLLNDYCNDLKKYLEKYKNEYGDCEKKQTDLFLTDKQFYLLIILTLLATLASLPFIFTTTAIGIIFSTISVTSLYIVCDIRNKDIQKNKKYSEFKKQYQQLERDLIEYQTGNIKGEIKREETICTKINELNKSNLKLFSEMNLLIKEEI